MSSAASMVIWVKKVMSLGQLGQPLHQLEALLAHGFQLIDSGLVVLALGELRCRSA